jgi:DNA-binding NarL/FixJ family response regulator
LAPVGRKRDPSTSSCPSSATRPATRFIVPTNSATNGVAACFGCCRQAGARFDTCGGLASPGRTFTVAEVLSASEREANGGAGEQREHQDRCRDAAMSGTLMAASSGGRMARTSASRIDVRRRETALALVGGPELLRAAVGDLIDAQPGMRLACSVASIEELADAFASISPRCDVVLLDVDSYRGGCARAVDRVLALELDCKLVLLCTEATEEIVLCASTRRIDGVVLKESSVCELCEAVAHILTGHAVMPARWHAAREAVTLTPRQLDVLKLISRGFSNEEIADQLDVRPNTVKFHISEIFRRLGVRNRIEAIASASEWYDD